MRSWLCGAVAQGKIDTYTVTARFVVPPPLSWHTTCGENNKGGDSALCRTGSTLWSDWHTHAALATRTHACPPPPHRMATMHRSHVQCVLALVLLAVSHAAAVDWGSLTQQTLSELPVSDFQSATSADISDIPSSACAGFDAAQLAALSATALGGMGTCLLRARALALRRVCAAAHCGTLVGLR